MSLKLGGGRSGGSGRLTAVEPVVSVVAPPTSAAVGGGRFAGSGIGTSASIADWLWASAGLSCASPSTSVIAVPVKMRSKRRPCMEESLKIPVGGRKTDPKSHATGEAAFSPPNERTDSKVLTKSTYDDVAGASLARNWRPVSPGGHVFIRVAGFARA